MADVEISLRKGRKDTFWQRNSIEFYMGDYAIHKIKAGDESLGYLVFYAPLRQD